MTDTVEAPSDAPAVADPVPSPEAAPSTNGGEAQKSHNQIVPSLSMLIHGPS
jgi:hypothetical protein